MKPLGMSLHPLQERRARPLVGRRRSSEAGAIRSRHRRQRGLSLTESLVTISIMGVAIVGIGAAVAQTEKVSGINQNQSQVEVAMRQLSDYVRDSSTANSAKNLPYQNCATTYTIGIAKPAGVTSWGVSAVYVSTSGTRNGVATPPLQTCSAGLFDYGVQEIKLFVTSGAQTLTRIVWKSKTW